MTHLIDKDALLAKIEKQLAPVKYRLKRDKDDPWDTDVEVLKFGMQLSSFINSLEVMEIGVDLGDPKGDKSAKYIIDTNTLEVKEADWEKEINDYFLTINLQDGEQITENTFRNIAKHFFELGLKAAQKGEKYE